MSGRKIPADLDNPIDNILIDLSERLGKKLHKYKFITPNLITTIGIIFGLISINLIYYGHYKIASILFLISYFFDCLDGNFARTYKMETTFGDYYDHLADIMKGILLIYVIKNINIKTNLKIIIVVFYTILHFLSLFHIACQEKQFKSSVILKQVKDLCINEEHINYYKYIGIGTANLIQVIILFFINDLNNLKIFS